MRTHLALFLFFIPFCFINLSVNIFVATSHCLDHQQILLLHLKNNLKLNPAKSKKLVHWNQSGDCCQWIGVACNEGRVTGLDLSEEFISGGLDNSSLFNLQHLQNLNLAYNDFDSSIPSKFGKLKNLRYLNLSNSGFDGQIPTEISHLTKLAILDLSVSSTPQVTLNLEKPNLRMLVQNLTSITKLYLDGVKVSATGKEWCHALSSLQKLQVLSMPSCNLSGPIDSSLAKLQSLLVIQLDLNNLSSPVPEFFANFTNLTTLQLSSCGLSEVFPKDIFHIQTLKVLDISYNQGLRGSLPNFSKDGSLQTLNLSNTNFSGELPGAVFNLKQLSTLDLSNCQFNGTLPVSMSELTKLVHLDLSFNNFIGPLPSFNVSKNLKHLSLFHNNLIGPISSAHLEGLVNLQLINFGDNSLNGKVPSSLFTLPSLQELTLSHNGFDGLLDEFPNASFSPLLLIDLSENKLQGPVPISLFNLTRISFLLLSLNQFNGIIRLDTIQRLQNLHTLGLSHNNLLVDTTFNDDPFPNLRSLYLGSCKLRKFPGFLRNHSQLGVLDLSNNMIQGIAPNWIWRFENMALLNLSNNFLIDLEGPFENISSNLIAIDLHSNLLHGSIPIFTKYAVQLDYSSNRLSFMPHEIGKFFPFLYSFSLSNNSFHGKIPESFCNSTLRLLDLSHNSFSGFIPKCLTTRSSSLRVLNLARNKLTGYISDTISSSCNLRFLDLNGNLLGGSIPKSLTNCQRLQVLNLGNNVLRGTFPCFLKNISTLRALILRSNKLQGPIECTHSTRNWEMLHIVDIASNNFTGTLPGTLLKSWTAMMGDEDETKEKSGNLFSDVYDFNHSVRYRDMLSVTDKVIVTKMAKLSANAPHSELEDIFSYYVNSNALDGIYFNSVTIVEKGLRMTLAKIINVFTFLDFSCNHFEGPIPEELMNLKALNVLNLSHNAFSSYIPSSLGNLTLLESLDLSNNSLSGEIPTELASLHFLSVLNLSFNHLVGKIPTGTQIQSFEAYSFEGNEDLCGPPLTKNCSNDVLHGLQPPARVSETEKSIDWNFLSAEIGFTFGLGLIILPLIFWKRWRLWYCEHVDVLLCRIFPQLYSVYEHRGGQKYKTLRWRR